jgi:uncharacterized membrane protein
MSPAGGRIRGPIWRVCFDVPRCRGRGPGSAGLPGAGRFAAAVRREFQRPSASDIGTANVVNENPRGTLTTTTVPLLLNSGEDATRELEQLRTDAERERDEILARLTDTASRLAEVTRAHAAELEQVRADAAREREELRGAMESRAQVLEESRSELRARTERAERAERDLDAVKAELASVRQAAGTEDAPGMSERRRAGQAPE